MKTSIGHDHVVKILSGGSVRVCVSVSLCVCGRAGLCLALACCAVSSCVVPCHHVLCCAARVVGVLIPKIVMNKHH